MSDPTVPSPSSRGVIHDLGYRPYQGPRMGEWAIARALMVTGFLNAFGIGRSGRSKVLPFLLLGINLLPAAIVAGVMVFIGLKELPIDYASYASTTQVLLGIFVAAQGPVLFSRDLRHGTITLYLARPLRASTYAVSRFVSLLAATLVFLLLPILVLYVVAVLGELDLSEQTADALLAVLLAVLLALSLTGVAGLISAWSTRRGFAVVGTIAVLLVGNGLVSAVQGVAGYEGAERVGEIAGLFSPYSLYRGLVSAWVEESGPTPPQGAGMEAAYVVVFLGLSLVCLAGLVRRYRRVAGS